MSTTEPAIAGGDGSSTVCTSPTCVTASARILSIMDSTVDPCQDFYQYACGRWIDENPIPAGKLSWSTYEQISQETQVDLKNIFGDFFIQLDNKYIF